ncbi:hypothetical protein ACLOJK_009998 [Asimina triloba]
MANLAFYLSLIFSLFLLTHARLVRFPSAVSHASNTLDFPEEAPLLPFLVKPDYSDSIDISKPAPHNTLESHAPRDETQPPDAVPLRLPAVMSFDLSFRPVNPRLPPLPLTDRRPLRPRRHRCHHRHPIRRPHVRVPYGDDMIVGRGGMRQVSQGELGTATVGVEVVRGPEGERAGEESRLRNWFWNIINGF